MTEHFDDDFELEQADEGVFMHQVSQSATKNKGQMDAVAEEEDKAASLIQMKYRQKMEKRKHLEEQKALLK